MSIDLAALRRICKGDPEAKIAVRRGWLVEVLRQLEDGQPERNGPMGKADDITSMLKSIYSDLSGRSI